MVLGRNSRRSPRSRGERARFLRRGRRKRAPWYTEANGPSAVTGPGPLLVYERITSDRPTNVPRAFARGGPIPVGDATALGTLRTRLETRTKESNMYASHWDFAIPKGAMKVKVGPGCRPREDGPKAPHSRGVSFSSREEAHPERTRWDPKDGELCLVRTKSGETLMEVRSDSDVQIDRRNWV